MVEHDGRLNSHARFKEAQPIRQRRWRRVHAVLERPVHHARAGLYAAYSMHIDFCTPLWVSCMPQTKVEQGTHPAVSPVDSIRCVYVH